MLERIPFDDALAELRAGRSLQERSHHGLTYEVVADSHHHHHLVRGVVILEGRLVPMYPSIGRILMLEAGIRRNFSGPFWAEEKMDGYNVRVVRQRGRLLAFTRGGHLCPYSCDRLPDLANLEPLFDEHPDLVLCGELAGKCTPYARAGATRVPEDVGFYAFDLMRLDHAGFVAVPDREAIFARHPVPRAPVLGRYHPEETERLRELVMRLDGEGSEGVVLKPEGEGVRVKYITPRTNMSDIAVDAHLVAELGGPFFINRLLRLVMGLEELGLEHRVAEAERVVGKALVTDFLAAVDRVRQGGTVNQRITVRVNRAGAADELLELMNKVSHTVRVKEVERRQEGRRTVVTLEKIFLPSTSRMKDLMAGSYVID